MYAVIKTGGKQYKVKTGDTLEVELMRPKGDETDTSLEIVPLLVVTDKGDAVHGSDNLAKYKVGVKVLGESKGEKITVFKYRNKSGYASKTGHRQSYSLIEITSIGSQSKSEKDEKAKTASPKKDAAAPAGTESANVDA